MKVKATKLGYYDLKRVKPGQVIVLKDAKQFSKAWMEELDGEEVRPSRKQKNLPHKEEAETEVI